MLCKRVRGIGPKDSENGVARTEAEESRDREPRLYAFTPRCVTSILPFFPPPQVFRGHSDHRFTRSVRKKDLEILYCERLFDSIRFYDRWIVDRLAFRVALRI